MKKKTHFTSDIFQRLRSYNIILNKKKLEFKDEKKNLEKWKEKKNILYAKLKKKAIKIILKIHL